MYNSQIKIVEKIYLTLEQKNELTDLWNSEYPNGISLRTIEEFETFLSLQNDKKHLLIVGADGKIDGWFFMFNREGERWFAMIIKRQFQGLGFGSKFLDEAKKSEKVLNGWVIDHEKYIKSDGTPYLSPVNFYLKNGFSVINESRLETPRLSAVRMVWKRNDL